MTLLRAQIVAAARGWIGTPYRHQASLKGIGCDCLGLLRGVWREVVGAEPEAVPPYTRDWAEAGGRELLMEVASRHLVRVQDARLGDVLLFRWRAALPAKHCAIVGAPGTMIHAHEGASVAEVAIAPFWSRQIAAAFAFPGVEETSLFPPPHPEAPGEAGPRRRAPEDAGRPSGVLRGRFAAPQHEERGSAPEGREQG